jgi:hypothetical protein
MHYKLTVEIAGVCLLTLLNLRGAKEAVLPWVPIFIMFVITHAFVIIYTLCTHLANIGEVWTNASTDMADGLAGAARLQHGRGHLHWN